MAYVKDVLAENWDDYQLRSIALGGNNNFYNVLKEYEIIDLETKQKYKHDAVKWYRARHMWLMDGGEADKYKHPKPAKSFDERLQRAQSFAQNVGEDIGQTWWYNIEEIKVQAAPNLSQMHENINNIHKHENVIKAKAKAAEIGSKMQTWGLGIKSKW